MMLTKKQLVDPPFKIDPSYYVKDNIITKENFDEKMRQLASDYKRIAATTKFFIPGVVNIFSDAAVSSEIRNKATIANVVTYTDNEMTTNYLSSSGYLEECKSHEAEIASCYYALMCANYNTRVSGKKKINLFTDSVPVISKLRPIVRGVMSYRKDPERLEGFLHSLNNDATISELIFLFAAECAETKCEIEMFHIKGHTRDLMLIATKFLQINGYKISVQDAIELTTYLAMVDSKVNKYIRCPSDLYNS